MWQASTKPFDELKTKAGRSPPGLAHRQGYRGHGECSHCRGLSLTTKGGCVHHEKLVSASAGNLVHGSLHASSGCFHSNCSFPDVYGIWPLHQSGHLTRERLSGALIKRTLTRQVLTSLLPKNCKAAGSELRPRAGLTSRAGLFSTFVANQTGHQATQAPKSSGNLGASCPQV